MIYPKKQGDSAMKKIVLSLVLGLFMLMVIAAATEQAAQAMNFKGYLANVTYGKAARDLGGHDLLQNPELLPVVNMLFDDAVFKSGYGLFVPGPANKDFVGYKYATFDPKGSDMAKEIVEKTKKPAGVFVTGEGTLDREKLIITVISMQEAEPPVPTPAPNENPPTSE
jgi:hypothetical protein